MQQCINDVVAFGLNSVEFGTCVALSLVALGVAMIWYLNQDIETKEERWARKNPFLAIDFDMHPRGKGGSKF